MLQALNLKDEYSESQLEEALVQRLEDFLLELGDELQNRADGCRGSTAEAEEKPADAGAAWGGVQVGESGLQDTFWLKPS